MGIVFFGSGPVAAKSLELLSSNFEIEAVITKPKPAHHRGDFPVITVAQNQGLKILYAANKSELSELFKTKPVKSKVGVLIDYGVILGQDVIDYFPLGIVNSHFSLLPKWRGADPITFSILNGDKKTGVSLMLIVPELDAGPILSQERLIIPPNATTPELTDKLIKLSYKMLARDLPSYISGTLKPHKQPDTEPTYSRKLTKEDGIIDWNKPAQQIEREIRAYIEWPKSRTQLASKEVIITKALVVDQSGEPGKISVKVHELIVYCSQKALALERLKPAGKNEMASEAFLAGHSQFFNKD